MLVEDYLTTDPITVPGQKFALLSIVSPVSRQKHDLCGIKIREISSDKSDAEQHVKRLQK